MSKPFNICVLISGGGTTLKNLIDIKNAGQLDANIAHVISSNAEATGNDFASVNEIPLSVVQRKSYPGVEEFSEQIFARCRSSNIDLVVMAGFLKKVTIPDDFTNRVINIHPSLIPAFSGKGYYGMKVHQAVVDYGCKVSGCTVHFVDNQYDHGPVIAQQAIQLDSNETPESLQERVFKLECELYPAVINQIALGQLCISERNVTLAD